MWSCWQYLHPNEVPGTWASQSFTFVDETGTEVTRTVQDFLDTTALGYVYDNSSACTRAPVSTAVAMQIQSSASGEHAFTNILFSHVPLRLNSTMTSMAVTIPAAARLQNTQLVLRDVSAMSAPGALINVYIAKNNQPSSRIFVATINWFGVFDHMGNMDHTDQMVHAGPIARTFEYNVTRQLEQLGFPDGNALTIIFEASSGLVPANHSHGASSDEVIAASRATLRPDAKLTIGAVELRQ
jgi:hypothetical protein